MNIAYFEPLSRGWQRMVQALFKPFDIAKWFVVGFSAFLAGLLDTGARGGGFNFKGNHDDFSSLEELKDLPDTIITWLAEHPVWAVLIIIGIIVFIIIMIVLTWISSKGKFMFLDNVVYNRALIVEPWKRFSHLGNSLFLWRLVFGFISFLIILAIIASGIFLLRLDEGFEGNIPAIMLIVLIFLAIVAIILFISMLVNTFVVPVMYKHNLKIMPAWKEFSKILMPYFFSFVLYALLIFVLYIAAAIAIIAAGFAMCCIGFILLIIPYINSVITLPVSYLFRAFSLEFLAQFGDYYNVLSPEINPDTVI